MNRRIFSPPQKNKLFHQLTSSCQRFFHINDQSVIVSSSTKHVLPIEREHDFLSLLRISRQDADHFRPIYDTPIHKDLFKLLFTTARNLEENLYKGQCGTSSCTVTGIRGIGKSITFLNFTNLLPSFHPNVIPIYVNYGSAKESPLLLNNSLLDCVIEELEIKHNIFLTKNYRKREGNVYHLNRLLQEKGKSVILMVDEMDKFYELDPDRNPKTETTLGELSGLGDSRYGRLAVVLCSSSGILPILVNAQARGLGYLSDYPVLKVAPNLNAKKFKSHRLPTSPPTDVQVVKNILNHYNCGDRMELVKHVTFLTGSIPRNIDALIRGVWTVGNLSLERLDSKETSKVCSQLWSKMMEKMVNKNLGIMNELSNHKDGINIEKVTKLDWPNEFSPLSIEEIESIWRDIESNKERDPFGSIEKDLYCLYDNDLIYFRPTYFGSIEHVYPSNMLNLFTHPLKTSLIEGVEKLLGRSLNTLIYTKGVIIP